MFGRQLEGGTYQRGLLGNNSNRKKYAIIFTKDLRTD